MNRNVKLLLALSLLAVPGCPQSQDTDGVGTKGQFEQEPVKGSSQAQSELPCRQDPGSGDQGESGGVSTNWQDFSDQGDAEATYKLGALHAEGRDYAQAMRLYHKAAEAGNTEAMSALGVLYKAGQGVKQDYAEAERWSRKAANAGDAGAMYTLGWLYEYGRGVKLDYPEAARWYQKAADAGYSSAMTRLGNHYLGGKGVRLDPAEAALWYRKAADAGEADAMYCLGALYHYGRGVKLDYREAKRWYRMAADAGEPSAKAVLEGMGK